MWSLVSLLVTLKLSSFVLNYEVHLSSETWGEEKDTVYLTLICGQAPILCKWVLRCAT